MKTVPDNCYINKSWLNDTVYKDVSLFPKLDCYLDQCQCKNVALHKYVIQNTSKHPWYHFRNCWKFCPNSKPKFTRLFFKNEN